MTLTIEQVRDTRFHLARRNGYEPVDVDNFVDKVETTLVQLGEENASLKQQVEALKANPGDEGSDEVRRELQASQAEVKRLSDELDSVRAGGTDADGELERLRGELQARSDELQHLRDELARRDEQIANLSSTLSSGGDEAQPPAWRAGGP